MIIFFLCAGSLLLSIPRSTITRIRPATWRWKNRPHKLFLLLPLLLVAHFPTLIAAGLIITTIIIMMRRYRERRKALRQRSESATMLALIVGELHAGANMGDALGACIPNLTEPTLRREVTIAARGGGGLEHSTIPALNLMGHAWRIATTNGMPLVNVLENIRNRIDHQNRHESRTKAALQGANATAVVLALLPLLGIAMGYLLGVNVPAFLTGGGLGGLVLIAGVTAECAGILWSDHIIQKAHSC